MRKSNYGKRTSVSRETKKILAGVIGAGILVAVISDNRYEWGLVYLAVATGVGVIVPLDKALPDNEIESLMMRSEIEAIVYSKKYDEVMNRVREEKNTNVKYFISMDIEKNEKEVYSLKQLLEKGKKKIEDGDREFLDAKINAEEMGIMLFTSGGSEECTFDTS